MLKCLNIIKKSTAPKSIHKFNAIPVRIATVRQIGAKTHQGKNKPKLEEQQKHRGGAAAMGGGGGTQSNSTLELPQCDGSLYDQSVGTGTALVREANRVSSQSMCKRAKHWFS